MKGTRLVGVVLILLGIAGFVAGTFTYTKEKNRVDFGPVGIEVRDRSTVHVSPLLAGLSLLAGLALTVGARPHRRL